MIKALLLIFNPIPTWDRIVAKQRSWLFIFFCNTLPLLAFVAAVEGYGLTRWGKVRGEMQMVNRFSWQEVVVFELIQIVLTVVVLFIGAGLIKSLGSTFRGGRTFTQGFTVAAYGLTPLFLLHVMEVLPRLWPWVSWAIGFALSVTVLYHGLPRVMLPELPQAFGFFLSSMLLLAFVTALVRLLAAMYLSGKFAPLEAFISNLAAHL
jgi:hypothetical protein